ncbi:class I SAM-dependent methyltransferase [Campylobacter porcelli]|uniref:SAM-dependent methyltransferase n=1 Tax=Campylobacter porcelli TaxID=1660073 RepID=A0A1X9SXZ9_9BACT|nr:class I SAM-dependent methyltransferase [Campylobacter sp. RM6137]ARR01130.1 SAM-dependent methyltransferase [Campylobacter sp. RM6137]
MDNSLSAYITKYDKQGYGLHFPDGHVIRFYERILNFALNKTSGNLLDFGCGNGVHSKYFAKRSGGGIRPFGIDIVPSLKQIWHNDPLICQENFHIIEPNSSFSHLFSQKMDFIFANQSLYYLTKNDFNTTLKELYDLCNDGAIIFATMMASECYDMYQKSKPLSNGLTHIQGTPTGRMSENSYIRFTDDIEQLKDDFKLFEPLYWGDYTPINLYNFEGSSRHFIFIGKK